MFIPDNLELYEIVPKSVYDMYPIHGEKMWMMFDDRLLRTYDMLRKKYGPAYLNNWYWGGLRQERGYRLLNTTTGSPFSQHKFGRAFDMTFRDYSADEVRKDILASPYSVTFQYIACVEMDVGWLHIDVGNRFRVSRQEGFIQKVYLT